MGTYLNGQLVIADDALVTGDVILLGGGNIETVANNDLTLLPNGTGITIVGDAGSTSHGLNSNDDLFVAGEAEVDGPLFADGLITASNGITLATNRYLGIGGSVESALTFGSPQTPTSLFWGLPGTSNALILCEKADMGVDFAHPLQTNPTLFIQSADATTIAQWVSFCHDQTDGMIDCGFGDIKISTVANQTLVLEQPVYDDMRVSLIRGLTGATNPPTFTKFQDDGAASVGVYAHVFADQAVAGNEEQMWFDAQLPHSYKEGTDIDAHIHWSPVAGGAAGEFVKWGLEYRWENVDGTFGNTTIIASDASVAATATTSGDAAMVTSKHYITAIGTITGTGKTISGVLMCRVFRNSSDATDDLAQGAFGLSMDFHHQVDTMGSRTATAK